jgi:hypothetical protein
MQIEMFDSAVSHPIRDLPDFKVYPWEKVLRDKQYTKQQYDLVHDIVPGAKITTYKSGASSKSDILGYIQAGSAIGICVMDASAPVRSLVADYVSQGGKVFADSGAFRTFMAGLRKPDTKPINFDEVFERYHDIIDRCANPSSLIVVAPDVVGNQDESFRLLAEYKREIQLITRRNVKVMVPMQKGVLSIAEHYIRCRELLDTDFVVGLPSNAEALSRHEVFDFISSVQPANIHFLGCSETALVHEAKHRSPDTEFTCDATQLRKHIGKGRLLTEMQNQILDEVVSHAMHGCSHSRVDDVSVWDETEILGDLVGYLDTLTGSEIKRFALHMNIDVQAIYLCQDNESLWACLDEKNCGYAFQLVQQYISIRCYKALSPKVRTLVCSELAQRNIV